MREQVTDPKERHNCYLGDGVYVRLDGRTSLVQLYTSNGLRESNEIFLEPEVLEAFVRWARATKDPQLLRALKGAT